MAHMLFDKHRAHLPLSRLQIGRHSPVELAMKVKGRSKRRRPNLFDDLFFGGSLAEFCELKLNSNPPPAQWGGGVLLGVCQERTRRDIYGGKLRDVRCTITVWTRHDIPNDRERRLNQLGTMVHEMIHAYFSVYSCHWRGCIRTLDRVGRTGHGFAWQDAAYAIATAAADEKWVNLPIQLGRCGSLVRELRASKQNRNLDVRRWGMGPEDVAFKDGNWVVRKRKTRK
jgi:hypothetical protein